jgi:hypothetical protein
MTAVGQDAPTLIEFLLARIAEDEAVALNAVGYESRVYWDNAADARAIPKSSGEHYRRHDPERVLAECEAKRRIVENLAKCERIREHSHATDYSQGELDAYRSAGYALAAVYADHPDYRPEWRP